MIVTVKGDLRAIERALKQEPLIARLSAVSAINRTAAIAQTAGVRELSASKKLPTRLVKARTRILRARGAKLFALLITLTAGVPVDRLKYRELKKGLSAAGRKFPHAFVAYRDRNHPLVFERQIVGGKRAGRLPIERVKISLHPEADQIFGRVTAAAVQRDLVRIFERELRYRLSRRA